MFELYASGLLCTGRLFNLASDGKVDGMDEIGRSILIVLLRSKQSSKVYEFAPVDNRVGVSLGSNQIIDL
jgi:hypothetical protein